VPVSRHQHAATENTCALRGCNQVR
jgi:hypothetical protein